MSTAEQVELLIEEYIRLYDKENPFEIFNYHIIFREPHLAIQALLLQSIFIAIDAYSTKNNAGEAFMNGHYLRLDDKAIVRNSYVPDIMYFEKSRWDEYVKQVPDWIRKPAILVPDLAVEVISHNDRYTDLNRKVQLYRQDAVKLIWVIDPENRSVDVHQANQIETLEKDDTLRGANLLPGLKIKLSELFAVLDESDEE